MTTTVEEFGQNAGKVWQALFTKGPLSQTKLSTTTTLDQYQLLVAIGWLAREDKICRQGTVYKLGSTNLMEKVGTDAGKVWMALSKKQSDVDVSSLTRLTRIPVNDVYTALGWLARENKIEVKTDTSQKNQQIKVMLK
ncbi:MAG TPA: winged helix-turn-helix domain-containing protein [Candidatus Thermoplasmatota archaeon]|nr:winged helix-turn-helix domain-containing protein [Candidatus Thermoplasmatota archaeon]